MSIRKAVWSIVGVFAAFVCLARALAWIGQDNIEFGIEGAAKLLITLIFMAIILGIELLPSLIACSKGKSKWIIVPNILLVFLPKLLSWGAWIFMFAWAIFCKDESEAEIKEEPVELTNFTEVQEHCLRK